MLKPASRVTLGDETNARIPAAICLRGPAAPPSVMSEGRLLIRMRLTTSAENPKVAALMANTTAGGLNSSSAPAIAGPTMMERFSTADCALLAAARCSSPTTAGVVARAAGSYDDVLTDVRAASAIARATGPFSHATMARAVWNVSARLSRVTIRRTRSTRSAINPPIGLVTSAVRKRVIEAAATHAGEWVALKTNTTKATLYAHDPLIEIVSPLNSRR